ncbi:DUF2848 family protein [Acetohalobium arabaticum]|uniref:DUF2848 domain-containing protein n=1 Tax=Acetohalobium arabaticum (strain ATCC 49924 / DSM 5501 / Z-7288) TaxID=574087 RepID=D9QUV0_ACEAZ|nr:DUF2848 family protein [Acetohalobium arabaticum]ADL12009.1 conserved hypothetical protein [Acetohalobium arabaticum DSM 5501]
MAYLEFRINGNPNEILQFEVEKMINAGYTGRNQEEVQKHVEELKAKGIPAPEEVPTYFPVFNDGIVQDEVLDALDETDHSGEAEYVLLCTADEIYVAAGSDHTDRKLEEESIPKAKQIYPNTISRDVWKLSEVEDHWDEIMMRSWVEDDGEKILFQEAPLSALLPPNELLERIKEIIEVESMEGVVIYSGTVGAEVDVDYSPIFEMELEDPKKDRKLESKYRMKPMADWYKKEIK